MSKIKCFEMIIALLQAIFQLRTFVRYTKYGLARFRSLNDTPL